MAFDETTVQKVWEKGEPAVNADPDIWRKDACGAWIRRDFYGYRDSQFGWEIDLVVRESNGETPSVEDLRPLQWQNNEGRRAGRLTSRITASGRFNKRR